VTPLVAAACRQHPEDFIRMRTAHIRLIGVMAILAKLCLLYAIYALLQWHR
jgi:hypothetical protein